MKLKELFKSLPLLECTGNPEEEIQGIAYSSKDVRPGYLFAALTGEKTDGFYYIQEAVENGAIAVLSERKKPQAFSKLWIQVSNAREILALSAAKFYGFPSRDMKIVGVTGTKGKTTVTYLIEKILQSARMKPAVIGTISYRGPGLDQTAKRTTPEAPDLQRMIRILVDHGTTHCLMEVSSHSLELQRVLGIDFDISVFTNLSGEHLDYHKSMDQYFEAKKKLFFLSHKKGMAIINNDNPWGKKLIPQIPIAAITYGLETESNIKAKNYEFNESGIRLVADYPGGEIDISSSLLGKPNLYNILAALAVSLVLNVPIFAIKEGIQALKEVRGRFEKIPNSSGLHVFVDYAHTDDALKNLLETARELSQGKIILVFGAGGDRDRTKRPRMGKIAGRLADWAIITSDNPRSEDPLSIIAEIEKGIQSTDSQNYEIIPDRKEAIRKAISLGKKGDYILIAGKGHEDYQILGDKTIHFDDAEVTREIFQQMEGN